ncbi:MAG: hypothetical protein ABL936_16735 [Aestuariivirga sp.]
MTPYWITVNGAAVTHTFLNLGVGVTARSEEDAREIVREHFGSAITIGEIKTIFDMSELEQNHVAPNIEPNWMPRGIWFPRGFR